MPSISESLQNVEGRTLFLKSQDRETKFFYESINLILLMLP